MTAGAGDPGSGGDSHELSRRELLSYAWLASLAFASLEFAAVVYRFALPRLRPGDLGGTVDLGSVDVLPGPNAEPESFSKRGFWWAVTEEGAVALYKVCTHLGCLYDWKPTEGKYICPCHGSQFQRDGTYIAGPAPRSLDRFVIRAVDEDGIEVARSDEDGSPVAVPTGSNIVVDTGKRILGKPRG